MVRSDDYGPFAGHVAQTFDLGSKGAHQKGCQKSTQDPIGKVIEHLPNLAAIAPYDTI